MTEHTLAQLNEQFETLMNDYNARCADYAKREIALMSAQESNTKNIAELTEATKGLVDAWNAANTLQRVVKWFTGFTGIGVFIAWWGDLIKIG